MRFAARAIVCFLAIACASGAATAPPPPGGPLDQLLRKARAASGAPDKYHLVSVAHEAIGDRTFTVTSETEGVRYRARRCAGDVCSGFYFDGERSYDTNLNDTALPLSTGVDALQLTLRAIASYAFTAPDFRADGGRIDDAGVVLRGDGTRFRRVAVTAAHGALLDAVIDPASGLVAGVISDERKLAFEFRDQRKVSGKLTLPFEIWLDGKRVQRFEERSISNERLTEPSGLVPAFAAGAAAATFATTSGVAPILSCAIGGEIVPCLLDTGNSGISISLELAERLGIEASSAAIGVQGIGRYATGVAKGPAITVGGATYPPAQYVVLHDMHPYGYDLVLGADVLAHARITVDYAKRTVTFAPPESGGGIPVAFENFIPILPVHLGDAVVSLAVDTGDESSINVADDYYAQHPGLFKATGTMPVGGIGGSSVETVGELPAARIADFTVLRPKIGATKRLQPTAHGHVGSGFLAHFTVVFDYAHARVTLVPRDGDAAVVKSPPDAR